MYAKNRSLTVNLSRDQRGTVSLESALMLPVIALCWAGVFLYFGAYAGALSAGSAARLGGLSASATSCSGEAQARCAQAPAMGARGWADIPRQHPLLDRLLGPVFTPTTEVQQQRSYPIPGLLGGGEGTAPYDYQVACNEPPPRLNEDQVLREVACAYLTPMGFGPCGTALGAPRCGASP